MKFELVKNQHNQELIPKRATAHSAGYDLKAAKMVTIQPHQIMLVPTGVKVKLEPTQVCLLFDRSSNPRKRGIRLANSVGVIDSDYYGNKDNDGEIFAQFENLTDLPVTIGVGDRILQAVVTNYLITDGDSLNGTRRTGGFGSTGV